MPLFWSKSKSKQVNDAPDNIPLFEDGRDTDIIILVIGKSGTGKSTFVNSVLNTEQMLVGHGMETCTETIQWGIIETVPNHPIYKDRRIVIVDTPGFEDSGRSDVAIFKRVSKWLEHSYSNDMKISGIVYVQDMSYERFSGHDRKSLSVFESVCGDDALERVVILLTKMERIPDADAREADYLQKFWSHWVQNGAQVMRFQRLKDTDPDAANMAAWVIIDRLINTLLHSHVLQLQSELVDKGLLLGATAAGKELVRHILEGLEMIDQSIGVHSRLIPPSPDGQNRQLQQLMDYEETVRMSIKQLQTHDNFLSRSRVFFGASKKPLARAGGKK